jgi:hypothetical protein
VVELDCVMLRVIVVLCWRAVVFINAAPNGTFAA